MTNTLEADLVNGLLVSVLCNLRSEVIEEYDEVIASLMGLDLILKIFASLILI